MKTASAKAKCRILQNTVRDMIMAILPIELKANARSAIMGETGIDIKLVSGAREAFPWAVECKNHERLNLWPAWQQAQVNADKEQLKPLLAVKRKEPKDKNDPTRKFKVPVKDVLIVLKAVDFFKLVEKVNHAGLINAMM